MAVRTKSPYCCEFPKCSFQTTERDRIDHHHIVPKSMPGTSNKPFNMMWLCPDHHRAVYVPGATSGQHAIKNQDSIVIICKRASSQGSALEYERCSDSKGFYYFYKDGETWER